MTKKKDKSRRAREAEKPMPDDIDDLEAQEAPEVKSDPAPGETDTPPKRTYVKSGKYAGGNKHGKPGPAVPPEVVGAFQNLIRSVAAPEMTLEVRQASAKALEDISGWYLGIRLAAVVDYPEVPLAVGIVSHGIVMARAKREDVMRAHAEHQARANGNGEGVSPDA